MKPLEALRFLAQAPKLPRLEPGEERELIRGVRWRKNRQNPFTVLELRYTADPDKDPERAGREWFEKKSADMGGVRSSGWQREYEIDWRAQAGNKVFSHFRRDEHVVPVRVLPRWYHRWAVWDYGLRNPTCCLIVATDERGHHEVEAEYYARNRSVRESAFLVHRMLFELHAPPDLQRRVRFHPAELLITGREELESWEHEFLQGVIGDPSMGERREADTETVLERFAEAGWYIAPGNRAVTGLMAVNDWFRDGRLTIQERCTNTIREVSYLVWAEHGDPTLNYREREVDRDNHTTDCLKMFANLFPYQAEAPAPREQRSIYEQDLEVQDLLERQRWVEQGGEMMFPSLGGGW